MHNLLEFPGKTTVGGALSQSVLEFSSAMPKQKRTLMVKLNNCLHNYFINIVSDAGPICL